jgi:hypothetical protein
LKHSFYKPVLSFYRKPPKTNLIQAIGSGHGRPWGRGTAPTKIRPWGSPAVKGKGRESTRKARATFWWSWASLRWPEGGCRREPETVAGGELRRRRSGVRGRRGRAGEVRWGPREVSVLPIWGGRGLRRESRGGQELVGARERRRYWGARAGPDAAFYRQMGKRRKARASSASALSRYGVATRRLRRSGRGAGGRRWQCHKRRGTWARSQQGKLGRWRSCGVIRGRARNWRWRGVARNRRRYYCRSRGAERRENAPEEEEPGEGVQGLICNFQKFIRA